MTGVGKVPTPTLSCLPPPPSLSLSEGGLDEGDLQLMMGWLLIQLVHVSKLEQYWQVYWPPMAVYLHFHVGGQKGQQTRAILQQGIRQRRWSETQVQLSAHMLLPTQGNSRKLNQGKLRSYLLLLLLLAFVLFSLMFLETESCFGAQVGLTLAILLPQPLGAWGLGTCHMPDYVPLFNPNQKNVYSALSLAWRRSAAICTKTTLLLSQTGTRNLVF